MLFEAKQRTRTAPKKPGEGDFAFMIPRPAQNMASTAIS
jgi:hypothetical protein